MGTETKEHGQEDLLTEKKHPWHIMLYNDDVNTFPHVIETLVRYCGHDGNQAHQCAMIVHHNGRCSIKVGEYDNLRPIWEALLENHLSAKIEET